jgi:hypothetical protein
MPRFSNRALWTVAFSFLSSRVIMCLRPTQGDEKSLRPATTLYRTVALSFVIPSEAEGSAVPRTNPGNAEYDCHRILISSSEPSFGLCGASTPTPDSLVIRTRADEMAACLSIVFRVARIGPRNCRSLGSARDDKKERATVHRARLLNRGILQIQFGQLALILFHAPT